MAKTGKKPPATEAPPKASVEQLNDEQLQVLFFQHKKGIKALLGQQDVATAEVKRIKAAVKQAFDIAKAEGISREEIELAIELETDAGREKMEATRRRQERVAAWLGEPIGAQADMVADINYEAGKRAAMSDQLRKPPSQLAQQDAQRWLEGFDEGVSITNAARARSFKPLGDAPGGAITVQ